MHTLKKPAKAQPTPKAKTKPRDPLTAAIATRLKEFRQKAKLSQAAVAEVLKVKRAAVAQWEDPVAGTTPNVVNLIELARLLKRSLDEIAGFNSPAVAESARETKTHYTSDLPPAAREIALAWARLPKTKQRFYEQAIRIDAATFTAFPEIQDAVAQAMVVVSPDYHKLTEDLIESRKHLGRQGDLGFDT